MPIPLAQAATVPATADLHAQVMGATTGDVFTLAADTTYTWGKSWALSERPIVHLILFQSAILVTKDRVNSAPSSALGSAIASPSAP